MAIPPSQIVFAAALTVTVGSETTVMLEEALVTAQPLFCVTITRYWNVPVDPGIAV
jgi:hypothetical protein